MAWGGTIISKALAGLKTNYHLKQVLTTIREQSLSGVCLSFVNSLLEQHETRPKSMELP